MEEKNNEMKTKHTSAYIPRSNMKIFRAIIKINTRVNIYSLLLCRVDTSLWKSLWSGLIWCKMLHKVHSLCKNTGSRNNRKEIFQTIFYNYKEEKTKQKLKKKQPITKKLTRYQCQHHLSRYSSNASNVKCCRFFALELIFVQANN